MTDITLRNTGLPMPEFAQPVVILPQVFRVAIGVQLNLASFRDVADIFVSRQRESIDAKSSFEEMLNGDSKRNLERSLLLSV